MTTTASYWWLQYLAHDADRRTLGVVITGPDATADAARARAHAFGTPAAEIMAVPISQLLVRFYAPAALHRFLTPEEATAEDAAALERLKASGDPEISDVLADRSEDMVVNPIRFPRPVPRERPVDADELAITEGAANDWLARSSEDHVNCYCKTCRMARAVVFLMHERRA